MTAQAGTRKPTPEEARALRILREHVWGCGRCAVLKLTCVTQERLLANLRKAQERAS